MINTVQIHIYIYRYTIYYICTHISVNNHCLLLAAVSQVKSQQRQQQITWWPMTPQGKTIYVTTSNSKESGFQTTSLPACDDRFYWSGCLVDSSFPRLSFFCELFSLFWKKVILKVSFMLWNHSHPLYGVDCSMLLEPHLHTLDVQHAQSLNLDAK